MPVLLRTLSQAQWVYSIFDFFMAFSILGFSFLIKRMNPLYLIYGWSITSSIIIILLDFTSRSMFTLFILSFLGIVSGAGALANSIIFFDQTEIMERGRVGGMLVFISTLISPLLFSLASGISPAMVCLLLSLTPLATILLKPCGFDKRQNMNKGLRGQGRSFKYYLLSWIMLSLTNSIFTYAINFKFKKLFPHFFGINTLLQYFSASIGSIIGGVLVDWFGRKSVLSSGLLLHGAGFAFVGFALTSATHHIAYLVNGFSWGFFLVVFYLIVWGETGTRSNMAMRYSLGLAVFHLSRCAGFFLTPYVINMPATSILLLNSLLIFISFFPLLLARETLPEDIMNNMHFEFYKKRVKDFLKREKS